MTDSGQFEAWQEILIEWQQVNRMKRLIQELYDQVGGTLFYLLDYAKKNDIVLPNRSALYRMADRIHYLMDQMESPRTPDGNLQSDRKDKTDGDLTTPYLRYCRLVVG
jgi:hypothetical protein